MNNIIPNFIKFHPVKTQRGLEILAGLVPWILIFFPIVGSFFIPDIVAYAVLAFNIYWLYRSWQFAVLATAGYLNLQATKKINWAQKIKEDPLTKEKFQDIHHLVIIPIVKEPIGIIERHLNSLLVQNLGVKNMTIILAMEERVGKPAHKMADELLKKYHGEFANMLAFFHVLVPGETMGKHSNDTFAAKRAKKFLVEDIKIPLENILTTIADADTVFLDQYFSLLTYKFLTTELPHQKFYQAPRFAYNNVSRVPLFVKLPSIISGLNDLAILQKVTRRFVISSVYSLSLKLLDSVNYWDLDYIPEDWHLYFKIFFAYSGKVDIIPLYIPVYIDAAESEGRRKTLENFYQQNKRWAWGIVDVPYVIKNFFLHPEIPLWDRLVKVTLAFEFHFLWSAHWFLLTLGATVPTILNPAFARTTLGLNLSRTSSLILTLCLLGLFSGIIIDILLDPVNTTRKQRLKKIFHPLTYLRWILMPIGGLIFGVLPGLESQTRLMLGKYIEYRVTEKVDKS